MPSWLTCYRSSLSAVALAALIALALPGRSRAADELADFNAAVEALASHNRVAAGYLRTGTGDLAALEIDRMQKAWSDVTRRFANAPPPPFKGNSRYAATFTGVQNDIDTADKKMDADAPAARRALQDIREQLSALRASSHVTVLADCVLEANKAYADFFVFDATPPDWSKPDLTHVANALSAVMKRCDALADPATRANPEFRRLIDGTFNGLTFIPKAIETKDHALLQRVIGELRAFDNLLTFRYG